LRHGIHGVVKVSHDVRLLLPDVDGFYQIYATLKTRWTQKRTLWIVAVVEFGEEVFGSRIPRVVEKSHDVRLLFPNVDGFYQLLLTLSNKQINGPDVSNVFVGQEFLSQFVFAHLLVDGDVIVMHYVWYLSIPSFV